MNKNVKSDTNFLESHEYRFSWCSTTFFLKLKPKAQDEITIRLQNNFIRAIQIKSLYNIHKRNNSDGISFVHTHTHTHYSFLPYPYYTHNICILYNSTYNTAIVPLMVIKISRCII